MTRERQPKERKSSAPANFYRHVGTHGWRDTDYFTFIVRSRRLRRWIAAQLPAKRMRILSIGCGTGELEHHLAELRHHVIGLDLSHPMLKRAAGRGAARLVQADAQHLPFRSAAFDVVLFAESIGHLALPAVFAEARRVLKKRGRLLITSYTPHVGTHADYRSVTLDEIADGLAGAGFGVAQQKFLDAKRTAVTEVPSAEGATLIYVRAERRASISVAPPPSFPPPTAFPCARRPSDSRRARRPRAPRDGTE